MCNLIHSFNGKRKKCSNGAKGYKIKQERERRMKTRKKQFSVEFQRASPHDVSTTVWRDKKSVKASCRPSHARGGKMSRTLPLKHVVGGSTITHFIPLRFKAETKP
jgi:hypothetical protein